MNSEHQPSDFNKPISLAKLATIFAVTFGIAFGLCTVGAMSGGINSGTTMSYLMGTSMVIEGVCLLGLLVVAIIAIIRSFLYKD